jgi:hypothetical protein
MRQFRGCSRLYYATYTVGTDGAITFGTPKQVGNVKSISREISSDNEEVWADNKLDDTVFGGTAVTRTFGCTRLDPEVEAELLGNTIIEVGTNKIYGTPADGSTRPYFAFGYALHDGDVNRPCEIIWGYKGIVNSISKTANTIDRGTGSEGQEIQVTFGAPDKAWTKTTKNELDFSMPITDTNKAVVDKWFTQVVTPDNAETVLA